MRAPRGLSPDEAALWERVAATIVPLNPVRKAKPVLAEPAAIHTPAQPKAIKGRVPPPLPAPPPPSPSARPLQNHGLDSTWDRKLARGAIVPDVTIDLHGLGLDAAHHGGHDADGLASSDEGGRAERDGEAGRGGEVEGEVAARHLRACAARRGAREGDCLAAADERTLVVRLVVLLLQCHEDLIIP